jgi:molybdenum cofactor cytidylyltransferase
MRLGCVLMASGHATRFGSDKLLYPLNGKPLAAHVMDALSGGLFICTAVVTRSPEIEALAKARNLTTVMNPDRTDDLAVTIRLGLGAMPPGLDGCLFAVCDQPGLRTNSLEKMGAAFAADPHAAVILCFSGRRGNPVIFPSALFEELLALTPRQTGRQVLQSHPQRLLFVEAQDESELLDIDTLEDLSRFTKLTRAGDTGPCRS